MTFALDTKPKDDIVVDASEDRAESIQIECQWRIQAVVDQTTQSNVTAAIAIYTATLIRGGTKAEAEAASGLSDADFAIAAAARVWVAAMQEACRALIKSGENGWSRNETWPAPPDGLKELAARF